MRLPERFKERTVDLVGRDEAEALFRAIEDGEAVKAFRVNPIKIGVDAFEQKKVQIDRRKVTFPRDAYLTREEFPGSLPEHHSGAIYMQDISAMSTVHAITVKSGAAVLDSCSAPGGKTTQLSAAVGEGGIVVANEYDRKRASVLRSNIERMGCTNTVVCNLDTAVLAEVYPGAFDLVLCDAPCSGEGMFRKNARAVDEWSEENVKMCAQRQREILTNVARCVKAGGRLLYSTCTFAREENEENVRWFLDTHADFRLRPVERELCENTSDGIRLEGCAYDMTLCRRIYPHKSQGEGQFIALFERVSGSDEPINTRKKDKRARGGCEVRKNRAELDAIASAEKFLKDNLVRVPGGELIMLGESVFLAPRINLPPFGVLSAGVCVGECQKGRIIPHHQLFSACGKDFKLKIELSGGSAECAAYLRGEEIEAIGLLSGESGYCAVLIDGCAVGGGKVSGGRCKNHYPKGLRN